MSTQILTEKINLKNNPEKHISIKDKICQIFPNTKVHAFSIDYDETPSNKKSVLERTMASHGLAAAILHAYNNQQHLRLTPDDIWLTIAQGIGHHINYNAEEFRSRFVDHEGKNKKEISIFAGDILHYRNSHLEGDWPEVVNRLVAKTAQAVKIDIKSLSEFSTTTKISLTARRIILLDTVKAYFSYKVNIMYGIPKVTLEGTLEDWTKLQEKVKVILNPIFGPGLRFLSDLYLSMDFWFDRLNPVVLKLTETYKGEVDEEFWANMASCQGSGADTISGWMMAFYPYDKNGTKVNYNSMVPSDIPDGRVAIPFTTDMGLLKFVAGFSGAQQKTLENSNELVVSPVIGWSVIDDKNSEKM